MKNKITISQVANHAGVSLMTVSRVINNKKGVSDSTANRVRDSIAELGYRPSSIARSLASNKTRTIGLVIPDVGNPFFSEIAKGVENTAYSQKYQIFLCNTNEEASREHALLASLEEKRVDGLILCSSRLNQGDLQNILHQFPSVVLVNRTTPNVKSIVVDDEEGAYQIVSHLISLGHINIGFLAGPEVSESGSKRFNGYAQAMGHASLSYESSWVIHSLPTSEAAQSSAIAMMHLHPELTAIVCFNDLMAVGVMMAAHIIGKNIPDDLSITGFDDIPLASLVSPALTTCRVPLFKIGESAMNLLASQLTNCESGCDNVTLTPELIIRSSTCTIHKG